MKKIAVVLLLHICLTGLAQQRLELNKLGFSIEIPKDWFSFSDAEMMNNLEKYNFTDDQMADFIKSHNESVILGTFTKYNPKKVAGIIPTIKIIMRNNPTTSGVEFLEYVKAMNEGAKKQLEDFKVEDPPVLKKISGSDAVATSYNFMLKMGDKKCSIKASTYYISRGSYFLTLNFIEEIGKENNKALFDELFSSIQLTNP